jgi:hypothetical protein
MGNSKYWGSLLLTGALGAAAGQLVSATRAQACTCAAPSWRLELTSVTANDPTRSHSELWPTRGTLQSIGQGDAWVSLEGESGQVINARAGAWP